MDKQKNAQKPTLYIVQPEVNAGPRMQDYFIWRKKKEEVPAASESYVIAGKEAETHNDTPENRMVAQDTIAVEMESVVDKPEEDTDLFEEIHIEMPAAEPEEKAETDSDNEEPAMAIKNTEAGNGEADSVQEEATAGQVNKIDPSKQSALVQYFLQQMKEKEVTPQQLAATPFGEPSGTKSEPAESADRNTLDENAKKIWRMVNTLARYPKFLEPPLVEAVVNGEKLTFQIDSKRGNKIRARFGSEMKIINIADISELKII